MPHCDAYGNCNSHCHSNRNSHCHSNRNSHRDSDTKSNAYANAMHREMYTDTEASPHSGTAAQSLALARDFSSRLRGPAVL